VTTYLAGLLTIPAALVGSWLGLRWWRRLRRAEGQLAEAEWQVYLGPVDLPTPPPPQETVVENKISFRSVPGSRRSVGRRPRK
jgi:hypothetical protein